MSDLDELMQRMSEVNAKDATDLTMQDIAVVVAYHRAQRARRAAGEKVTKPKIDISEVMQKFTAASKPATKMERRL